MNVQQAKRLIVSVIIPVYNEEKSLALIIEKVRNVNLEKQIIVVNDGSTDGTKKVLANTKGIDVIHDSPTNKGKGFSIRRGLEYAKGEIIIIQDADLELDPQEYPKLIAPIVNNEAMVVYGSRFLSRKNRMPLITFLANSFLSFLTSMLFGSKITDMETCYKIFHASLIPRLNLKSDRFEIEPEITAKFLKMGQKIHELPITYIPRSSKEGKKIKFKDGLAAIYTLIKCRFFNY